MKELYASFIGALIRFWDNRFQKASCDTCEYLKTEVARLRAENSSLVDRVLGNVNQPADVPEPADSKLETIHRAGKSWKSLKQELERQHSKAGKVSNAVSGNDLAAFESAIEELENAGN